jgi:uncharacterized protein YggT (Ycf19 family)
MNVVVVIVSTMFALAVIGLSIRANARFRSEKRLPMQWMLSRTDPLSKTVTWYAPRFIALGLTPVLAICVLGLVDIGATVLTPRPGQEGMLLPSVLFIGSAFVAVHVFHLRLIEKTLRCND